jgi:hypothetical protein
MSALKLVVSNEVEIKFVNVEEIFTEASKAANRKPWHQNGWSVCNTCGYSVTFGFVRADAAKAIVAQGVTGVWFYKHDVFFGEKGYGAIFCDKCQHNEGWNECKGRRFKKMSAAWTKKKSFGGF